MPKSSESVETVKFTEISGIYISILCGSSPFASLHPWFHVRRKYIESFFQIFDWVTVVLQQNIHSGLLVDSSFLWAAILWDLNAYVSWKYASFIKKERNRKKRRYFVLHLHRAGFYTELKKGKRALLLLPLKGCALSWGISFLMCVYSAHLPLDGSGCSVSPVWDLQSPPFTGTFYMFAIVTLKGDMYLSIHLQGHCLSTFGTFLHFRVSDSHLLSFPCFTVRFFISSL